MRPSTPPSPFVMNVREKQKHNWLVRKYTKRVLKQNIALYIMFLPIIIYFLVFKFYPMSGLVIAFKNYNFINGIWGSSWAGLTYFKMIVHNDQLLRVVWNTLKLSVLNIVVGFPMPIILALLLNEVRKSWYKRTVQTLVYLPHFLNWVIIGGIIVTIFSQSSGAVNHLLERLTGETFPFLYNSTSWISIYVLSGIWKEVGWGAIIYLAAMTSIDPSLYEAASMDGANKWKQITRITIPSIMPTVIIMLILKIGSLMEVGFDQVYNLQNNTVIEVSEVISSFMYKVGIQQAQFSLATAMGLFDSIVCLILVILANSFARRYNQGLW
ncbi:MAG TPA: ABC transporter permease subunit [Paenibacillus sp.]